MSDDDVKMPRKYVAINALMFIGALFGVALYVFGLGFKSSSGPVEITHQVLLSPMIFFVFGFVLQNVFDEEIYGKYFAFLPLLSILVIQGANMYQDHRNLTYRERVVGNHLKQNTSYLKLVPAAMFPESAQRYLIRSIDSAKPDFVVALVFPRIESIDDLGNITYDYSDKKEGVQLALVMIRNKQPNFYVTELLEGYHLNPFAFSNVGYYEKNTIMGSNPNQFELTKDGKTYHFEIGDPNLTQIKLIDVDGVQIKIKKPVAFDQLNLYLK